MGVYRRGKDWYADYYYAGHRYRRRAGDTKGKAELVLAEVRLSIAKGTFVPPPPCGSQSELEPPVPPALEPEPLTVRQFAEQEFLPWSEAHHSASHHRLLTSILRVHLLPSLGEVELAAVKAKQLDDYVLQRRRKTYRSGKKRRPVKEATVNRDIACIKVLFRKAVEWERLEDSPARRLRSFKELPNPPRLLLPEEILRLLEIIAPRLKALVACAVYAGLRRDELFHLRWRDIDWKNGELHVVSRDEHPTKNRQSRRIPLGQPLREALRQHQQKHRVVGQELVFGSRKGVPYDNIRKALANAARRAEIEGGVGLHQLRHAFCSHALMQGIDARTVQRWMGHQSITTTLRYAHVSSDHEKAAIERLRFCFGHYWSQRGVEQKQGATGISP